MNKKNNISNKYKDYKYTYDGYDKYIKQHHLDKKEIKEEKEKIIHDHRNVFDFDNPNQHQHDYSFDFDQNQQKLTPNKKIYSDRYNKSYDQRTNYSTKNATTRTAYSINQNTKRNSKAVKIIKIIIFLFFIFPILLFFLLSLVIYSIIDYDTSEIEYTEIEIEKEQNYLEPILTFCEGLEHQSFSSLWKYLTDEEIKYDQGYKWKKIIYNYDELGNKVQTTNRTCNSNTSVALTTRQIDQLEKEFAETYQTNIIIDEAYNVYITEHKNGYYNKSFNIIVIKRNNKWFLLKIEY